VEHQVSLLKHFLMPPTPRVPRREHLPVGELFQNVPKLSFLPLQFTGLKAPLLKSSINLAIGESFGCSVEALKLLLQMHRFFTPSIPSSEEILVSNSRHDGLHPAGVGVRFPLVPRF